MNKQLHCMVRPFKIAVLSLSEPSLLDQSLLHLHLTHMHLLTPKVRRAPPASLFKKNICLSKVVNLRGWEGCGPATGFPGN